MRQRHAARMPAERRSDAASVRRRSVVAIVAAPWLLAAGCSAPSAAPTAAPWTPPRGGLVTHELAGRMGDHGDRRDARLGHPPTVRQAVTFTEIELRTRLSTSGNGRITDSVRRRVETTTILRDP